MNENNTTAADLDRDIAHLIDSSENGIARVPRETLVRLRALLTSPRAAADAEHRFKNFHRLLCERFDYTHDEIDWKRDQVSLIEHIAKKIAAPRAAVPAPKGWKLVPVERSYDMRVKALIAFNTTEKETNDRDDALDAAHRAMLDAAPAAPVAAPDPHAATAWMDVEGRSYVMPHFGTTTAPAAQAVAADGAATDETMSLQVALDFADNPRPFPALCAPADTNGELYRALRVLADAYRRAAVSPATAEPDLNALLEAAAVGLNREGMDEDARIVRGMKPGYPPKRDEPATADERAALREMLDDARNEFTMVREALGVAYEPHQTLLERTLEAARASQAAAPASIGPVSTWPGYKRGFNDGRKAAAPAAVEMTRSEVHALNDAVKMMPSHGSLRTFRDRLFAAYPNHPRFAAAPAEAREPDAFDRWEQECERDHGPYPEDASMSKRLRWWIPKSARHGKTGFEHDISDAADMLDSLVPADAGEAVGVAGSMPGTDGFTMACFDAAKVPIGTKLYAARVSVFQGAQGGKGGDRG